MTFGFSYVCVLVNIQKWLIAVKCIEYQNIVYCFTFIIWRDLTIWRMCIFVEMPHLMPKTFQKYQMDIIHLAQYINCMCVYIKDAFPSMMTENDAWVSKTIHFDNVESYEKSISLKTFSIGRKHWCGNTARMHIKIRRTTYQVSTENKREREKNNMERD